MFQTCYYKHSSHTNIISRGFTLPGDLKNGQEGEYCIIKAMNTAHYLYEANQVKVYNKIVTKHSCILLFCRHFPLENPFLK